MGNDGVKIWEEEVFLPTYPELMPEKIPLFIEKRAYQGSTGKVYPIPVIEKISDQKEERLYHAVFLENEYLKIMVLPELGGRIHRALDKTNGYDFVYFNHVVKPALVGLAGPWISGGIEFNWPQHHRPSTYMPVEYELKEREDGSCAVYVSETDRMYGTKGMACIALHPGKAYIEIQGQLYNHTDLPQTFLWWANPAVPVNENTYSVFPPDVNAVMDHGKRAVSTFPIATGEYYKWDYSAGVDISRYKNVKVPTSFMAAHSDFDFIGNYDEGKQAGLLHVADHHISPGKKQWTWGSGDFGKTWDRNLTDEDGPYIELMTGVFTDNQPDFTWLKPGEEKVFTQYFMPYKGVGRVGNATKDGAVSFEQRDGKIFLKVYVSGAYPNAHVRVTEGNKVLTDFRKDLDPTSFLEAEVPGVTELSQCEAVIWSGEEDRKDVREIVRCHVYTPQLAPVPSPAEAIPAPEKLGTTEELYLAATHLEQYRHATREPAFYYEEGLRRDPSDIRLNNGYGLLLLRRGRIRESISCFEAAVRKQTWKNPNPYSGESYFNLGLALEADGQADRAFDAFFKATWSGETQSTAFFWLARLACRKGNLTQALEFVDRCLVRNWHDMRARTLKAAIMRRLGKPDRIFLRESLDIDPLYMGCLFEQALFEGRMEKGCGNTSAAQEPNATEQSGALQAWKRKMREPAHNYLELALDYQKAGLTDEALQILDAYEGTEPMPYYYKGAFLKWMKRDEEAENMFWYAEQMPADCCFPNRVEEIPRLESAGGVLGEAPMADYYLGCLLYDKKQYDRAAGLWEKTVTVKPDFAMAWRNLSIYTCNKKGNLEEAFSMISRAVSVDPAYPRYLLEWDQMASRKNLDRKERLSMLASRLDVTRQRDDLTLRYISLLCCDGQYEEALAEFRRRRFHPWEGGEGKVSAQYRYALRHLARARLREQKPDEAMQLLFAALTYPENLGEGKLPNTPDNQEHYLIGLAWQQKGQDDQARKEFALAAAGSMEPELVRYYNDQPSDYIFYQGLALEAMGDHDGAVGAFHRLVSFGEQHLFDEVGYDYFAVSLPEIEIYQGDLRLRNTQYCNYLRALGALGLSQKKKACALAGEILSAESDHQGALDIMRLTDD